MTAPRSLETQRQEFARRRLIAMPIAGIIAWTVVGIAAMFLNTHQSVWVLFIATGMTAYLGMFISRFTGEHFLDKTRPKNTFDRLFFYGMAQALLVYSIAIPFFLVDHTSVPLTVGILTGLMWIPLSWIIQHWVGLFHSFARTGLVVAAWYLWPEHRFTAISVVIVAVYIVSIVVLEARWRRLA